MGDLPITKRILLYVEDHLDQELSLEKIAQALNYSKYYIARTFKEHTGMTLYKYIQGRRLDEAARKLAETKQPIVQIAFEAGYSTQQAFTQAFRCVYAATPQEYRRIGIFVPKQLQIRPFISSQVSQRGQFGLAENSRRGQFGLAQYKTASAPRLHFLVQSRRYRELKHAMFLSGWEKERAAS